MKRGTYGGVSATTHQPLDVFTAQKSRPVSIMAVPCPTCSSAAGVRCVKPDGTCTSSHTARRRIAVRAENNARP